MEAFGAAQVLLDGDEEAPVLRELGHVALRGLVELLVAVELREEARRPAGMHECRHLEEELPGVVAPCGRKMVSAADEPTRKGTRFILATIRFSSLYRG